MRCMITLTVVLTLAALGLAGALSPAPAGDLSIGINIGTPPPPMVVMPPPPVVVAPGMPAYYYGGRYFVYHEGAWLVAERHDGPWAYVAVELVPQPVLAIPGAYYRIPPGRAKEVGPPPWAGHGRGHKHEREDD